jgi:hypothetical protein
MHNCLLKNIPETGIIINRAVTIALPTAWQYRTTTQAGEDFAPRIVGTAGCPARPETDSYSYFEE